MTTGNDPIDVIHTTLRAKGQITIPQPVRDALGLRPDGEVLFVKTETGYELRPARVIDATQAWFWAPKWQVKERQADEDLAASRMTRFTSDADLLHTLEALPAADADA